MKIKINDKENQYLYDMVNSKKVDVEDELNLKLGKRTFRNILF